MDNIHWSYFALPSPPLQEAAPPPSDDWIDVSQPHEAAPPHGDWVDLASPSAPPPVEEPLQIDPQVWRACAGTSAWISAPGSTAFYFPNGHAEQCTYPTIYPDSFDSFWHWYAVCLVSKVRFLVAPDDEVFVRYTLDPLRYGPEPWPVPEATEPQLELPVEEVRDLDFFATVLQEPEASQQLHVQSECAEAFFPALNIGETTSLTFCDIHGAKQTFDYECTLSSNGELKLYSLTTGWPECVRAKNVADGDTLVFIWQDGQYPLLYIRRRWKMGNGDNAERGFTRVGRVSAVTVIEACYKASKSVRFEVDYYPMTGSHVFVVGEELIGRRSKTLNNLPRTGKMLIELAQEKGVCVVQKFIGSELNYVRPMPRDWPESDWRKTQVKLHERPSNRIETTACRKFGNFSNVPGEAPKFLRSVCWEVPIKRANSLCVNDWQLDSVDLSIVDPNLSLTDLNTRQSGSVIQAFFKKNSFPIGIQSPEGLYATSFQTNSDYNAGSKKIINSGLSHLSKSLWNAAQGKDGN